MKEKEDEKQEFENPWENIEGFGTTTLGERGQVVIPAEIREKLGLEPGEKFMVLLHGFGSVVLLSEDRFKEAMSGFEDKIKELKQD